MPRATLHQRHESLELALSLFWRKGFHATSLKDLEQTMDMRPGSIYATFGSKDQLFQEAIDRYAHLSLVELERILSASESPLEGLATYLRQLGGLCDQELPCRACMLLKSLLELGEREQVAWQKAETLLAAMETRFTEQFAAAKERGELASQADPERLGRRLQAEVMGLRAFAQRNVESDTLKALADDMAQSVEALRTAPSTTLQAN